MHITLIVAMGANRVIGVGNRMPWHLSADLKRFRQITLSKPILMGRKTHESIGRPLPGRLNIVLTRDTDYRAEGCTVVHDPAGALDAAGAAHELMVIGGADLYRSFLPRADRLHLTLIHRDFAGDTFFPDFDPADWQEVARQDVHDDPESGGLTYSFLTLERKFSNRAA